jgi:hypothetical protein
MILPAANSIHLQSLPSAPRRQIFKPAESLCSFHTAGHIPQECPLARSSISLTARGLEAISLTARGIEAHTPRASQRRQPTRSHDTASDEKGSCRHLLYGGRTFKSIGGSGSLSGAHGRVEISTGALLSSPNSGGIGREKPFVSTPDNGTATPLTWSAPFTQAQHAAAGAIGASRNRSSLDDSSDDVVSLHGSSHNEEEEEDEVEPLPRMVESRSVLRSWVQYRATVLHSDIGAEIRGVAHARTQRARERESSAESESGLNELRATEAAASAAHHAAQALGETAAAAESFSYLTSPMTFGSGAAMGSSGHAEDRHRGRGPRKVMAAAPPPSSTCSGITPVLAGLAQALTTTGPRSMNSKNNQRGGKGMKKKRML